MKEKISIIGAAGFLGSNLRKVLLNKNHYFESFDINNESEDMRKIDVEDIESLNILDKSSVIINLAAVHRDDIRPITKYDDVNVKGAQNVCDTARKLNINKIVFTSSVAIYGNAPINTGEDGEPNYFNDYGRTKYLAELVYKKWQEEDPTNRVLVIIRPTVIFGEGNRGNVYNLMNQISKNRFVMVGNGTNIKSMAYVENVAEFIAYSLDFNKGINIYNYVDKPDTNMNQLVAFIRSKLFLKNNVGFRLPYFIGISFGYFFDLLSWVTNISFPISSIRVKKFTSNSSFSSAIEKTNFKSIYSIEEALNKTLQYEFIDDNSDRKVFFTE